ncbi:calcineurin-like phosphoesterase family protein [uncultured Alistipes sp.]|uniref:calcineurin-like phosphoesterase family protein n=1 Tax=uncultured Alistipes sp. TaxID=538949 RepID=UPI0025DFB975|nr:calcineurin-like phosphoesterase family protein [uncultured Alistipes sp.]
MKSYLYILKIVALLLAATLCAVGCSDSDTREFERSERLVHNLYFSATMSVYNGQTLTLQGVGFEPADVVSFRTASGGVDLEVRDVTAKTARIVVPASLVKETYDVYVVRGVQEQYVATVRIYITTDLEVPDKEGMTVKGVVYCGDRGVPGVRVSDGLQTVVTNENGYYWLPSLKTLGYVFITIPSGYHPAVFDNDMMGFWARLGAGAETCETHNFELVEVDNDNHVMLVGADLHLANKQKDVENFKKGFLAETAAFALSSPIPVYCLMAGDMTWDRYWYDNKFKPADYRDLLVKSDYPIPVFNVMGNHDNDPYVTGDAPGQLPFCQTLGPSYYSFNLGKVHYVVLDDIDWINTGGKQGTVGNRDYNRLVSLAQMEWLAEDLAAVEDKAAPLVICLHVQLYENYNKSFSNVAKMSSPTGGTQALINAVQGFSDVHFVSGHTHHNATMVISESVIEHNTAAVCETWWWSQYFSGRAICVDGTPAGYGVYTVNSTDMVWSYKSIGESGDYQFRTYDMNTVKAYLDNNVYKSYLAKYSSRGNGGDDYAAVGANEVFINVWNYDPTWKISVHEDGKELSVGRIFQRDPLHTIVFDIPRVEKGYDANSDWASCNSSHMFSVTAKDAVSTLEITVTDRFGTVYTERMTRPKAFTKSMK